MNDQKQTVETGDPMKKLLKRAVESQQVPVHLEMKVRSTIRQGEQKSAEKGTHFWAWMIPGVAAAALAAVALVVVLSRNPSIPSTKDPNAYIAAMSAKVSTLMRVGLGDHIHCAVFRKYPQAPPPVEKMQQELGPDYAGLLDAVKASVPSEFKTRLAHKCRFQGRQFVHLVLKTDDRLVSVVVASKKDGEGFEVDRLVPALARSGVSYYQQNADAFQIAAFSNAKHVVYVISDLPQGRNMDMLLAMSSSIDGVLPKI